MRDDAGRWITYNGEVYNYPELRLELGGPFRTGCDTEVVMRAHERWGADSLDHLRGMFAYALWDEVEQELLCARDRFGIKPFYYAQVGDVLYFASEAKALLPFLPGIETDLAGAQGLPRVPVLPRRQDAVRGRPRAAARPPAARAQRHRGAGALLGGLLRPRLRPHGEVLRGAHRGAARRVGAAAPAQRRAGRRLPQRRPRLAQRRVARQPRHGGAMKAFTGRFPEDERYDESRYAQALADERGLDLHAGRHRRRRLPRLDRAASSTTSTTRSPGPARSRSTWSPRPPRATSKVILGGQGGDEIFGGYTRYLIAYFEQCIKAAIDGTMHSGNFVVTYESIIPNLVALRNYKPLLKEFWRDGLFEDLDARYFRLINRAPHLGGEVDFDALGEYSPFETFQAIFNGRNVGHESYFDKMTHFDFKTLLPALLQVEDRVSMAHGLESRVPLLDHELVELAATIPADVKFKDGTMKHVFKRATRSLVPDAIADRKDKMGFPVPLHEWFARPGARVHRATSSRRSEALGREHFDNRKVLAGLEKENRFGRQTWGLLSLELWQRLFHDREHEFKQLLTTKGTASEGPDHGRGRFHRLAPRRSAVG